LARGRPHDPGGQNGTPPAKELPADSSDEEGRKHSMKETVIETSINFYVSNLELGSTN
jgi:hypothetical protein